MRVVLTAMSLVLVVAGSGLFSYTNAHPIQESAFERTWLRADQPVREGIADRTWMWGPSGRTEAFYERYDDAPAGARLVQYTDKSRMEDNSHRARPPWDVTNGLLVVELITGRMQVSDHSFEDRSPANVQVAGDDHPDSPTYAMLDPLRSWNPLPVGSTVIQRLHPNGSVTDDGSLSPHGVTAGHFVSDTNHTVASVFWNFMNSSGTIFENGSYRHDKLFENPFFATGFPITEAYWVHVPVGGQWQDVLLQCFERRCLTYTPGNPSGWQVEAGNVGQHYYQWRYESTPVDPSPTPPPNLPDPIEPCAATTFPVLDNPTPDPAWLNPRAAVTLAAQELGLSSLILDMYREDAYFIRGLYHISTVDVGCFNKETNGFYNFVVEYMDLRAAPLSHLLPQVHRALEDPTSEIGAKMRTIEYGLDPHRPYAGPGVYWTDLIGPTALRFNPVQRRAIFRAFEGAVLEYETIQLVLGPDTPDFGIFLSDYDDLQFWLSMEQ